MELKNACKNTNGNVSNCWQQTCSNSLECAISPSYLPLFLRITYGTSSLFTAKRNIYILRREKPKSTDQQYCASQPTPTLLNHACVPVQLDTGWKSKVLKQTHVVSRKIWLLFVRENRMVENKNGGIQMANTRFFHDSVFWVLRPNFVVFFYIQSFKSE